MLSTYLLYYDTVRFSETYEWEHVELFFYLYTICRAYVPANRQKKYILIQNAMTERNV